MDRLVADEEMLDPEEEEEEMKVKAEGETELDKDLNLNRLNRPGPPASQGNFHVRTRPRRSSGSAGTSETDGSVNDGGDLSLGGGVMTNGLRDGSESFEPWNEEAYFKARKDDLQEELERIGKSGEVDPAEVWKLERGMDSNPQEFVERVRMLEDFAYELGLWEDREVGRGKFLHVLGE